MMTLTRTIDQLLDGAAGLIEKRGYQNSLDHPGVDMFKPFPGGPLGVRFAMLFSADPDVESLDGLAFVAAVTSYLQHGGRWAHSGLIARAHDWWTEHRMPTVAATGCGYRPTTDVVAAELRAAALDYRQAAAAIAA